MIRLRNLNVQKPKPNFVDAQFRGYYYFIYILFYIKIYFLNIFSEAILYVEKQKKKSAVLRDMEKLREKNK